MDNVLVLQGAGEFVLSFRYNSKKQELKICIWQIIVTSLISASQMPKVSITFNCPLVCECHSFVISLHFTFSSEK